MIKVKKRNGAIVDFNPQKIIHAVNKALKSAKIDDAEVGKNIANSINQNKEQVSIEEIHDAVETGLMENGFHEAAKRYILYRHDKKQKLIKEREDKKKLLNIQGQLDPVSEKFSLNSLRVLESRYLIKDENLKVIETPTQLFERIATHVGCANIMYDEMVFDKEGNQDKTTTVATRSMQGEFEYELSIGKYKLNQYNIEQLYSLFVKLHQEGKIKTVSFNNILDMIQAGEFDKYEKVIKSYYDLMVSQRFMPNTPTIINAGRRLSMLSACFVLPIDDDIREIMKTVSNAAFIAKSGGGVGINFSNLREEGAPIKSTSGTSSGPLSFMNIIDAISNNIKQGGVRRSALMGILNSNHPDIRKFIHAKETPGVLENFNVSVGIDNKFWDCMINNEPYDLISPNTGKVKSQINPRDLFNEITQSAWNSAEPGNIFLDNHNKYNVMKPVKGELNCTNPCGEIPMYPYEPCTLASINLAKFVKNGLFDFQSFSDAVELGTEFLDSVVDINKYDVDEIGFESWKTRRIGLGIMGLGDLLYILEIPYNSEESYRLQEQISQLLSFKAMEKSVKLAEKRGAFPYFEQTSFKNGMIDEIGYYEGSLTGISLLNWDDLIQKIKDKGIRNVYTTTNAPTGSISMIADTSSGIEPLFALAFEKKVHVGDFYYVNPYLEKYLRNNGIYYDDDVIKQIASSGSCQNTNLPEKVKKIFVTSMDIHWMDHVMAQAVWQRWINQSISKTINLSNNSTMEDIKNAYIFSHEIGCRGTTVYRDGSREKQVLYTESMENKDLIPSEYSKRVYNQKMTRFNALKFQVGESNKINLVTVTPELDKTMCLKCKVKYIYEEGCFKCPSCFVTGCNAS